MGNTELKFELGDIGILEAAAERALSEEVGVEAEPDALRIEADVIAALVTQVITPLLISIGASLLTDAIKAYLAGQCSREELEADLQGHPLLLGDRLPDDAVERIRPHVYPFGVEEAGIEAIYAVVREDLLRARGEHSTANPD